jgi:glycosyltransferase involved in cell wall biosynthesis
MFEAMAVGRAVLLSASGEAGQAVERLGCGIVVPPKDLLALADSICRPDAEGCRDLREMGAAGRADGSAT